MNSARGAGLEKKKKERKVKKRPKRQLTLNANTKGLTQLEL